MTMFTTAPATVGKNAPDQGTYDSVAVTPSDSVDIAVNSDGRTPGRIRVTGAGDVAVNLTGGGTATLTGLAAGQIVQCAVTRVLATGTTATGITALF